MQASAACVAVGGATPCCDRLGAAQLVFASIGRRRARRRGALDACGQAQTGEGSSVLSREGPGIVSGKIRRVDQAARRDGSRPHGCGGPLWPSGSGPTAAEGTASPQHCPRCAPLPPRAQRATFVPTTCFPTRMLEQGLCVLPQNALGCQRGCAVALAIAPVQASLSSGPGPTAGAFQTSQQARKDCVASGRSTTFAC